MDHGDYHVVMAAKDVNGNVGVGSFFKVVPKPSDIREYPPVDINMNDHGQRTIENYRVYSATVSSGTYMDGEYKAWATSEHTDRNNYKIGYIFGTEGWPGWHSWTFGSGPIIFGVELPSPIVLSHYKIQNPNVSYGLKRFFMEGSNDGMTWDELDYQDDYTNWVSHAYHTFIVPNPEHKAYKSFRWRVLSTNGGNYLQIYDLRLFGYQIEPTEVRSFVPLSPLNATINSANFNTSDKTLQVTGDAVASTNPTIFKAFATIQHDLTPDQVRTMINDPANADTVYDFSTGAVTVPKVMSVTGDVVYDSSTINYANVYVYGTDGIDLNHDSLT
jgi:hypothetical protein